MLNFVVPRGCINYFNSQGLILPEYRQAGQVCRWAEKRNALPTCRQGVSMLCNSMKQNPVRRVLSTANQLPGNAKTVNAPPSLVKELRLR